MSMVWWRAQDLNRDRNHRAWALWDQCLDRGRYSTTLLTNGLLRLLEVPSPDVYIRTVPEGSPNVKLPP